MTPELRRNQHIATALQQVPINENQAKRNEEQSADRDIDSDIADDL